MVKKIRCDEVETDWVKAEVSVQGDTVNVEMMFNGMARNVILTPADALKLRKQIKKALEAIEGTDQESGV